MQQPAPESRADIHLTAEIMRLPVKMREVALLCWLGGITLGKLTSEWKKKVLLAVLLTVDIGAMLLFKILPVFADMGFMIPIGLSYYTFQSAGYLIDVYCERAPVQKNPAKEKIPPVP